MATVNLGRIGFVNKGTYNGATAYKVNDVVTYNTGTYACIQANTGQAPTNTSYWQNWVADNAVHKTGDQTISGIKTFTSSPIVPAPTIDSQAATKKYVDDNAGISLATANSYDLGVGQTWQDVTASRSAGVTYTNTTGKPIEFKVKVSGTDAGSNVFVDGIEVEVNDVGATTSSLGFTSSAIVPNGSTYSYGLYGGTSHKVYELR